MNVTRDPNFPIIKGHGNRAHSNPTKFEACSRQDIIQPPYYLKPSYVPDIHNLEQNKAYLWWASLPWSLKTLKHISHLLR